MGLISVNSNEIVIGKPVPWALYNEDYGLLLQAGEAVRDQQHWRELMAAGACREITWESSNVAESFHHASDLAHGDGSFCFNDMHLKVEDRLQLEPPHALTHERFIVKVIGYIKGTSLLVSAPIGHDGLRILLKEKDSVIVRSFSGINAFAFRCTVKRIVNVPAAYLHLSFPEEIQGIKVRKAPRVKTNIITSVQNRNAATPQKSAVISNISSEGLSLVATQSIGKKGDVFRLAFRVPLHNVDAHLSVNGVIRTLTRDSEADAKKEGYILHGIEFQDLQPNDRVVLQSMIYQQMIENPHRVV